MGQIQAAAAAGREQGKQLIMQHISKYIKLKQTELNQDLTEDILENLKECK
jgi:hypothetical protein